MAHEFVSANKNLRLREIVARALKAAEISAPLSTVRVLMRPNDGDDSADWTDVTLQTARALERVSPPITENVELRLECCSGSWLQAPGAKPFQPFGESRSTATTGHLLKYPCACDLAADMLNLRLLAGS